MSIAFIRETTGSIDTSVTTSVTLSAAAAAGNVLVAAIAMTHNPPSALTSISTTGVTWTQLGTATRGLTQVELWLGVATSTSGTAVTFSGAFSGTTLVCNISEFSGVDTASPVDVTAASANANSTSPTVSYTTATANDIVFAIAGWQSGTAASATPASFGYTMLSPVSVAFNVTVSVGYKATPVAGGQFANWTISLANWATLIVGLKQSSSVPVTVAHTTSTALTSRVTKPHTTSAALKATAIKTHTADSAKYKRTTLTSSSDALILIRGTRTHGTSSFLVESGTRHITDSLLRATKLTSSTSDAALKKSSTVQQTTSAALAARTTRTHTTSSHLKGPATRTHTTSIAMVKRGTTSHSASTYKVNRPLPPSSSILRVGTWTTNRPSG